MAEESTGGEKKEEEAPTTAGGEKEDGGEGVGESKEGSTPQPAIDVSKPVSPPDKAEYEAKTNELNDEVTAIKEKMEEVEGKIAEARNSGSDQSSELKEAKEALKALREQREQLQKERSDIMTQQESAKNSLKAKVAQTKSLRAELKYETPEKYDERIMELEKKQSTTSMSLRDEKNLLKEIEQLKSSKKLVTALAATNSEIQADKQSTQTIGEALKAKIGELDEMRKQFDKQKKVVDSLNEANSSRKAVLPALFREKDALRKEKQAKIEAIRALRADFKQKEIEYRDYKRELVRLRKEERKKEEEARQAAIEERRRKAEEEELKRVPYEEEMELCDYLVNFLTTNYGAASSSAAAANDENAVANKGVANEFEGMVLGGKAAAKEEDYLSLNSQFGKKKGRGKKKGGLKVAERISLVPETIEIFAVLNLDPPATLSAVQDSVKALKDKKAWFKDQPRGAVPSIRDKQRAEEAKAHQSRRDAYDRRAKPEPAKDAKDAEAPAADDAAAPAAKKQPKKKSGFNAAEAADEAFPSLPGAPPKDKALVPPAVPVEESKDTPDDDAAPAAEDADDAPGDDDDAPAPADADQEPAEPDEAGPDQDDA